MILIQLSSYTLQDQGNKMSLEAIIWAFKQENLTTAQKIVLLALGDHCAGDLVCYPSIKHLSKKTCLSTRSVQNALKSLVNAGLLTCHPQFNQSGRQTSNYYKMTLPECEGAGAAPTPSSICRGEGAGGAPTRVQELHTNLPYQSSIRKHISEVFNFWKEALDHPNAQLSPERKRCIKNALTHSSISECKKAIVGCSKSKHHMGHNDSNRTFDKITLILRNREYVEQFMGYNSAPPVQNLMHVCKKCKKEATSFTGGLCEPCSLLEEKIAEAQDRKLHPLKLVADPTFKAR